MVSPLHISTSPLQSADRVEPPQWLAEIQRTTRKALPSIVKTRKSCGIHQDDYSSNFGVPVSG